MQTGFLTDSAIMDHQAAFMTDNANLDHQTAFLTDLANIEWNETIKLIDWLNTSMDH